MANPKIQNVEIIFNGVLKDAKWGEDYKSGLKIEIESINNIWPPPPLANKYVEPKGGQMLGQKGGPMLLDLNLMPYLKSSH